MGCRLPQIALDVHMHRHEALVYCTFLLKQIAKYMLRGMQVHIWAKCVCVIYVLETYSTYMCTLYIYIHIHVLLVYVII